MHKAVIEIGNYTVKEAPTGGWRVLTGGQLIERGAEVVSVHERRADAIAAAKQAHAFDVRRVA